jgi:hypothetical protein
MYSHTYKYSTLIVFDLLFDEILLYGSVIAYEKVHVQENNEK